MQNVLFSVKRSLTFREKLLFLNQLSGSSTAGVIFEVFAVNREQAAILLREIGLSCEFIG
jgi:hypothetical protein